MSAPVGSSQHHSGAHEPNHPAAVTSRLSSTHSTRILAAVAGPPREAELRTGALFRAFRSVLEGARTSRTGAGAPVRVGDSARRGVRKAHNRGKEDHVSPVKRIDYGCQTNRSYELPGLRDALTPLRHARKLAHRESESLDTSKGTRSG